MWRSKNILLVEHDPDDRFIIERALKSADEPCIVVAVQSAAAAERHLRSGGARPSFVLLDLDLPMESGLAFLNWLRRTNELRSLPAIVLSSSNRFRDIRRAFARGANGYFVKRMEFDDLPGLIQEVELLNDSCFAYTPDARGESRIARANGAFHGYSNGCAKGGIHNGFTVGESRTGKG